MPKYYVTYRLKTLTGLSIRGAIECPSFEEAIKCASDMRSYASARYVRLVNAPSWKDETRIIPWEEYKNSPDNPVKP